MHRFFNFIAATSLIALFASQSFAAVINYNESVSGDLSVVASSSPNLAFGIGINTVTGTQSNADLDLINFTIPAGGSLTSASVTGAKVSGNLGFMQWTFYDNFSNLLQFVNVSVPGSTNFTSVPKGPGIYQIAPSSGAGVGTSSYTFSFTVIPEPASLSLLGLSSMMLLRRKRS